MEVQNRKQRTFLDKVREKVTDRSIVDLVESGDTFMVDGVSYSFKTVPTLFKQSHKQDLSSNWEDILDGVIKKWNAKADGYNQWDYLGVDEMLELTIKFCMGIPRKSSRK